MNIVTGTKTPHILLLEDDRAHQDLIVRAFRNDPEQYRVSIADNLKKAREILERDPPELIIADWVLPDGKGLDILIREDGAVTIPLIIMTSFGDEQLAVEIMKSGAIDYVVKSATMFADMPHIARRALRDWENIHERKRAELVVRDYQKRLADILSFLPDAVLAIDIEGRVIGWNNAMERMTGVAAAVMLGKGDYESSIPFYGERRPILVDLVLMDNAEIEKKYDYIQRDGDQITSETFIPTIFGGKGAYLWGTASPLFDSMGNRAGAIEVIRDITERKQNEELLRQREVTLETLLNAPSDTILLLDRKWNIIDINEEGARRFGGTVQELTGRCSLDLLPPALANVRKTKLDRVFESGETVRFDDERSGAYFHNEVYPIFNKEHTAVDQIAIFARDITEQKQAEEALRESEERFSTLLQNVPSVAVQGYSMDGTTRYWNEASERFYGYSQEEALGKNLLDLIIPPEMRSDVRDAIRYMAETGQPIPSAELSLMKKGGSRILVYSSHAIVRKSDGSLELFCIDVDMTQRKQAETALRESETRFKDLFNNIGAGVAIYEPTPDGGDFIIRDINHAVETIEQVRKDDIVGRRLLEVFPGVAEFGLLAVFQRVAKTGIPESHPVSLYHDNRISGWRENYVYRLPSGEVVALYEDVTEKKKAEEAEQETRRKYTELFELGSEAILLIDNETGAILEANSAACEMYGYSREALLSMKNTDLSAEKEQTRKVTTESPLGTIQVPLRYHRRNDSTVFPVEILGRFFVWNKLPVHIAAIRDITSRKLAEEALIESERRYRSVVENASDGIVIAQDERLQYANPRLLEMIGVSPEEIAGHPFADFIHPDDRGFVLDRYKRRVSGENVPQNYDFRVLGKNKKITWVQLSAVRIVWNNRPATLNFITDISERKQMEETLQKSEQEFRSLAESMPQIVWITRADGWNIYFNQQWMDYTGLSLEESYGHGWNIPFHPDDQKRAWDAWQRATQHHDTYSLECRLRRADGVYRWWLIRGVPVRNASGEILKWFGTCTDIESIKQTEDKLRESEERYLSLFNRSLDCIYIHDLEGQFIDANASALELLGYSRDEIPSLSFQNLLGPDDLKKAKAAVETIAREGSHSGLIEYRLKRKDGSFAEIETKATLIVHDGKPSAVFGIARDITVSKQVEVLKKAYEERLGSAMEIGSLAWWEMDLPDGAVRFDARKAIMLGYPPEKFRHYTDFTQILHPDDDKPTMQAMKDHLEGKAARYHADYRIRTSGGNYRWFRDVGGITGRHPDGSPATVTGIVIDITVSKQAEEALQESEQLLGKVFDNANDAIFLLERTPDGPGKYLLVNDKATRMLGYAKEELMAMSPRDIVPEYIAKKIMPGVINKLLKDGHATFESAHRKKDGSIYPIEVSTHTFRYQGKDVDLSIVRDITGRRKAEEAIRQASERLLLATQAGGIGIWELDLVNNRLIWDDQMFQLYGIRPDAFSGTYEAWRAGVHPDDLEQSEAELDLALRGEKEFDTEFRVVWPDKTIHSLHARARVHQDSSGNPLRLIGTNFDITARHQAEEALRESQERYRLLADNINDVLWVLNLETGKWMYVSPSVERLRGYTVEEVLTQSVEEVMTPASFTYSQNVMPERVERFLQDESGLNSYLDEVEQTCRDGSTVWTEVANRYIRNEQGELTLLGLSRDISTRKEAARELEESETRFRALIQNSSDIIRILGSDGRILYESPSSERILGYPPGSLIGKDPMEFIHPDDVDKVKNDFGEVIDRKNPGTPTEFRIRKADGEYVWVDSIGTNLLTVPGINGIVITTRPIQQRKLAEEQINKTIAQLERNEALLRKVYDILPIGLWLADKTGKLLYGNPAGVKIWGAEPLVPLEEYGVFKARHYPSGEEIAPDDWALAHTILEGVTIKDELLEIDAFDGKKKIIVNYTAPLYDSAGAIDGAIIVNQEITERVAAEQLLKISGERLSLALEATSDGLWDWDLANDHVYWSPRAFEMLGYAPDEFPVTHAVWQSLIHPDERDATENNVMSQLKSGNRFSAEFQYRTKDGSWMWILGRGRAVAWDAEGNVTRMVGTHVDLTEQKKAERALQENQARLATAMDIAGLVNWEFDVATGMFTFDDRFYTLYETTAEREGGNLMSAETYLQEFVYPDDRPKVLAAIRKVLETTDPDYSGQVEHRITPRDGSIRTIIARYAPVMGPDGTVIQTIGANQDITDFKLMESEIRSLNTVLEQRIKDRTEALSTANEKLEEENAQRLEAEGKLQASFDEKVMLLKEIHHRVKNNLQIIASLLNLQSRYISDPQTLAAIRESQNRVKAMALVHEKLYRSDDISHISLHDYIRFLGTGLFQFYDAKIRGIQFTLEITDINVDIDSAIPLGLILNELISNSLKYAFPEGTKGAVSISVKKEEHTLTVLYRDTGIGIPADLDWRDTPSLGLRLVNTLVDQMNGTVDLDRSNGTLFTMVLHEKEHREEK